MGHWLAGTLLALAGLWQPVRPGVWKTEMPMASDGPLSVVRAIAVRLDPARLRFDLAGRDEGFSGRWTIDRMPSEAVVAFNAGQFRAAWPWGWLVRNGVELQKPGGGSVSMAFVVDSSGRASLITPNELPGVRGHALLAFQSYPALLVDGEEPWEIQGRGRGVDLQHRDSRLALGILEDSSVVVVITRFRGLGPQGESLPWGPTVGEMAAFMRSLGCQRAMLLDGGISSQLALRGADGLVSRWANWRGVPLGLTVTPQ